MSFNLQEMNHEHDSRGASIATRSYDCVFCQRGFTTAQALGGHMNIHRKDRATTTNVTTTNTKLPTINKHPEAIISHKQVLIEDHDDNYNDDNQLRLFYSPKSCFSSNGGTSRTFEGVFNLFGSSSKNIGSHDNNMYGKRVQEHDDHIQDDGEELDLELRLGHHPW